MKTKILSETLALKTGWFELAVQGLVTSYQLRRAFALINLFLDGKGIEHNKT